MVPDVVSPELASRDGVMLPSFGNPRIYGGISCYLLSVALVRGVFVANQRFPPFSFRPVSPILGFRRIFCSTGRSIFLVILALILSIVYGSFDLNGCILNLS